MPITLYHMAPSPPSRAALIAAKILGLEIEIKIINLFQEDHKSPEYLKINPLHTIPLLDDNGFILADSHAIACYLVNSYSKDDKLYPKDPQKRALVDQRLYFDASILFPRLRDVSFPVFFLGEKTVSEEKKAKVLEALGFLEGFLSPTGWLAGENFTIADSSCVATVSSFPALGIDLTPFKNVTAWLERCRDKIPDYQEVNQVGVDTLGEAFAAALSKGD